MKELKGTTLKGKTLEQWFRKLKQGDFQDLKVNYVARYDAFEDFVRKNVHPLVATGAAVKDRIFLNEHGAPHIAAVINRASQLATTPSCILTAYEVYLLLAAIQLHDAGNILGREGHESRVFELEGQIDALLGGDSPEKRIVREIAKAHGGKHNGNADTIQQLVEEPVLNQRVRRRFIAALLRFADELADDSQRVSQFAIENKVIPAEGEIFHTYSASLNSVIVDTEGKAIRLHFELTRPDIEKEFVKNGAKQYLIDEIMLRTLKMHRERIYCMRFLTPGIQIDSISVTINCYKSNRSPDPPFRIGYRLEDKGYPSQPDGGIYELCPELETICDGQRLSGPSLIAKIAGTQK